jgi:hypothetical protein
MAEELPPSNGWYNGAKYDPSFFTNANQNVSLSYLQSNYLQRVGVPTSIATNTNFSGSVNATALSVGGSNINTIYQTQANMSNYALLASPTFTGTPSAPTASVGTNTTQLATTAFVLANSGSSGILSSNNTFTGTNTFTNTATFSNAFYTPAGSLISATNDIMDLTTTQTISGAKTFSTPPDFNGVNITVGSIPVESVMGTAVNLTTTQTISGQKTFSTAPSMSGGLITSGTIPTASVIGTAVNLTATQNISGQKTFTTAPFLSGTNITSGTIPVTSVVGTAVNSTSNQTIGGTKTFSNDVTCSSAINLQNPPIMTYTSIPSLASNQIGYNYSTYFSGSIGPYGSPTYGLSSFTLVYKGIYIITYVIGYYTFPQPVCVGGYFTENNSDYTGGRYGYALRITPVSPSGFDDSVTATAIFNNTIPNNVIRLYAYAGTSGPSGLTNPNLNSACLFSYVRIA